MTKEQLEDYAIGFDELGFEPNTLMPIEEMEQEIKKYQNMFKELLEDLEEKDRLFKKLYLATEENKLLLKQNRSLERKVKMLKERVEDYAARLGIDKNCIL